MPTPIRRNSVPVASRRSSGVAASKIRAPRSVGSSSETLRVRLRKSGVLSFKHYRLAGKPLGLGPARYLLGQVPQNALQILIGAEVGVEGRLGTDALRGIVGRHLAIVLAARQMIKPRPHAAIALHQFDLVHRLKLADQGDTIAGEFRLHRLADAPDEADRPFGLIWGVGKAMQAELARDGLTLIGQLQAMDEIELMKRYGSMGARLYHLSRGEDYRQVSTDDASKSISAETTFNTDLSAYEDLERILWNLAEKVSRRAKAEGLAGHTVVLKLKTRDFRSRTRNVSLAEPTLLAARIFEAATPLLRREATGTEFRLIGVGISRSGLARGRGRHPRCPCGSPRQGRDRHGSPPR